MRLDVVSSSREEFGSDRSALRLAKVLTDLGAQARLVLPAARRERGLAALAAERGIASEEADVLVVSSRGLDGARALLPRRKRDSDATIYNTSAVSVCAGDVTPRLLVLREWVSPASIRHRVLARHHSRRVEAVVPVSTDVGSQWLRCGGVPPSPAVAWNWLEDDWLEDAATCDGRSGILYLGRFSAWKGQMALADAYQLAFGDRAERPSLTFVGAEGRDSPFGAAAEQLRRRSREAGWSVEPFTRDPRQALRRAALVVIPSLHPEPFGNVVLEALASGCKVLAFPGGGPTDLAPLFPDTLKVIPREIPSLAAALTRWWSEGGAAQAAVEREAVLTTLRLHFSEDAARSRWAQLLDRHLSVSRGQGPER
jgi:glycosyltransferase involved in cell wall biosynthesis